MGKTRKDKKDGMDVLPVGHLGQPPFCPGSPASTPGSPQDAARCLGKPKGPWTPWKPWEPARPHPGRRRGWWTKTLPCRSPRQPGASPGIEATLWNGPRIRWVRRATHRGPQGNRTTARDRGACTLASLCLGPFFLQPGSQWKSLVDGGYLLRYHPDHDPSLTIHRPGAVQRRRHLHPCRSLGSLHPSPWP